MNRRRVLSGIGGSIGTLALAGCLDDLETDDSDDEPDEDVENGDENDEETTEEEVDPDDSDEDDDRSTDDTEALIESAEATLEEASDEFEAVVDETDDAMNDEGEDGSHGIETRPIEALLDEAEADLSAARDGATSEQHETISALEDLVDFFRDFIEVVSDVGDAMDELELWEQYIDTDRWAAAAQAAARADNHTQSAMESATVARSTFDDIDTESLDDLDEIDVVEIEVILDDIDGALVAFDALVTAAERMARGMQPFIDAVGALDRNEFGTAQSEFRAAADWFDDAYRALSENEDDVPMEYRGDLIELSCEMDSLGDMAHHYALAAEAMDDDDYESANYHFEQAETAESMCESTDAVASLG